MQTILYSEVNTLMSNMFLKLYNKQYIFWTNILRYNHPILFNIMLSFKIQSKSKKGTND